MTELRDKAKVAFTDWHYGGGVQSLPDLLADFAEHHAAECVSAERERVADEIERITNGSSCELNLLIQQLRTSNDEIERITNGSSCELNLLIQQLRTSK